MNIRHIAIAIFLALSVLAYGQAPLDSLRKENKEILPDSLNKVQKEVKEMLKTLNKDIKAIQEESSRRCDSLQNAFDDIFSEYEKQLRNDSIRLNTLRKEWLAKQDMADIDEKLASKQDELNQLQIKPEIGVDAEWQALTFAEIRFKSPSLAKMVKEYEKFSSADNKYMSTYQNFCALKSECDLYDRGLAAIESEYDQATVGTLSPQISKLLSTVANVRKSEVVKVNSRLKSYGTIVKIFQSAIDSIENEQSQANTDAERIEAANRAIEPLEADDTIEAFLDIPWLNQKYTEYHKALMEGRPSQEIPARNDIMNLQP